MNASLYSSVHKIKTYYCKIQKKINNSKFFIFLPKNIFMLLLFVLLLFLVIRKTKNSNFKVLYSQSNFTGITGPLLDESYSMDLRDISLDSEPTHICYRFATYARVNSAYYDFIISRDGQEVYREELNARKLKDNDFYCFKLKKVDINNINDYKLTIEPVHTDTNNCITLYQDSETGIPNFYLSKKNNLFCLRNIIILVILIFSFIINYLVNTRKIDIDKFWLVISFAYVIPIMIIIPPYQVPDEAAHYASVYNYTQYTDNPDDLYLYSPRTSPCVAYSAPERIDRVNSVNDILDCLKESENDYVYFQDIRGIKPYGYIISIIGLKLADIISNSPLVIFYCGRLFSTLFSIYIVYYILRKTTKYKSLFLFVATIPMFLQQMISYSYDSLLNSFSLLLICFILVTFDTKKKRIILPIIGISICLFFILGIKFIYIPIVLLLLLSNKKQSNKTKKIAILFGTCIASFIAYKICDSFFSKDGDALFDTNNANYLKLISNPLSILPIAFNTLKGRSLFYLKGLIGYFGWFRYDYDWIIYCVYCIFSIYLILSNENKASIKSRIIPFFGICLSIGMIFASMYLTWSNPELNYIDGVQGRYFIPLVLPLMILLLQKRKIIKGDDISITYQFVNMMVMYCCTFLLASYY